MVEHGGAAAGSHDAQGYPLSETRLRFACAAKLSLQDDNNEIIAITIPLSDGTTYASQLTSVRSTYEISRLERKSPEFDRPTIEKGKSEIQLT